MRAVLDEGVPRDLAGALSRPGIATDPFDDALAGLKNGELLTRVEEAGYDVLVTNDRNMAYQQNLAGRSVAVLALPSNRWKSIVARCDDIADAVRRAVPGAHLIMNRDGTRIVRRSGDGNVVAMLPRVPAFRDRS